MPHPPQDSSHGLPPQNTEKRQKQVVIIGGGPAGLTGAVQLCKQKIAVTVLEKDKLVGGIARTEAYKGFYFDIGGHRFFTKITEVSDFWEELLGPEFITRPRISRIFYQGRFFDYPLKALNALTNLGILTSVGVVFSYLQSQLFPYPQEDTFEEWVSNRFGKKLYQIFFKTYTEKVWGIPCSEIRAEFAAQRIKGLNLPVAIWNAIFGVKNANKEVIKTLIEQFEYPRFGPGMMWAKAAEVVQAHGNAVEMNTDVVRIHHKNGVVTEVIGQKDGKEVRYVGTDFISSMPIIELIQKLDPPPPPEVLQAANGLSYRDFLTVVLIIRQEHLFDDNWIYIHSPEVKVGRIQNFKNWSPEMVPEQALTSLGLEYFCTQGDEIWDLSDQALIELGTQEMQKLKLVQPGDVMDGVVVRQLKAYPVYNATYSAYLQIIKTYLSSFSNLQTVGRNGLHKYNNQDHSMLTAMLAVRNLGGETHDLWEINTERSYHEEIRLPPHDAMSTDRAGSGT
jgi:protoporphyrinogen oxidase